MARRNERSTASGGVWRWDYGVLAEKLDVGEVDEWFYSVIAYRLFLARGKVDQQVGRNYVGMVKAVRRVIKSSS